jgi:hypothetical protein
VKRAGTISAEPGAGEDVAADGFVFSACNEESGISSASRINERGEFIALDSLF